MKKNKLIIASYLYLIIPVIVFYLGWIKQIFSIPLTVGLIIILYIIIKRTLKNEENSEILINKKRILVLFFSVLGICILAGLGGFFYQSNDYHWRNAIFRDMINLKWPVYYENMDASLNYYIGFWIVPAAIAKIFLSISESFAWGVGNVLLLLWATIGVLLVSLWIVKTFKLKSKKDIMLSFLLFIMFSGLDIIGTLCINERLFPILHIEWWASQYQFSSISTQLFWVFNQAICAWLITWMFLNEKKVNNYFLLILICLPYAPLPFCGLMILFAYKGIEIFIKAIKKREVKEFFKDAFSVQNILAIICILPIYYFYYKSNAATSGGSFRFITEYLDIGQITRLFAFWLLEIGIYFMLLLNSFKKEGLFYAAFCGLFFIPFFAIGGASDFAMRASIPLLIVCIYYVIRYFINYAKEEKKRIGNDIIKFILIVTLLIGSITPLFEYTRAIATVIKNKNIRSVADDIITFSDKDPKDYENFISVNPKENSIFFKYFANR